MKTLLAKLENIAAGILAEIKQWAIVDWNATVADYHAACDWLCRKLKAALRTI